MGESDRGTRREKQEHAILKYLEKKPHQSTSDIAKAIGANLGTLRNYITRLIGEQKICVSKVAVWGTNHYSTAIPKSINDELEINETCEINETREPNEPNETKSQTPGKGVFDTSN